MKIENKVVKLPPDFESQSEILKRMADEGFELICVNQPVLFSEHEINSNDIYYMLSYFSKKTS